MVISDNLAGEWGGYSAHTIRSDDGSVVVVAVVNAHEIGAAVGAGRCDGRRKDFVVQVHVSEHQVDTIG